jgi:hypothetical protein
VGKPTIVTGSTRASQGADDSQQQRHLRAHQPGEVPVASSSSVVNRPVHIGETRV